MFKDYSKLVLPQLYCSVLQYYTDVLNYLVVASTDAVAARLSSIIAFFHATHSTGTGRFHQPTKTGVCNSLLMSLKTPTTNNRQPKPIARRPGLPSAAPIDTPTIVIVAPAIVRILLITDIPNPPCALADDESDDGVHLSDLV